MGQWTTLLFACGLAQRGGVELARGLARRWGLGCGGFGGGFLRAAFGEGAALGFEGGAAGGLVGGSAMGSTCA